VYEFRVATTIEPGKDLVAIRLQPLCALYIDR